jgi:hypothetical protein
VGQEPHEIEQEIEATRARLTESIDALTDKLDPRNVAKRTADTAKEKFFAVVRRASGHPG